MFFKCVYRASLAGGLKAFEHALFYVAFMLIFASIDRARFLVSVTARLALAATSRARAAGSAFPGALRFSI